MGQWVKHNTPGGKPPLESDIARSFLREILHTGGIRCPIIISLRWFNPAVFTTYRLPSYYEHSAECAILYFQHMLTTAHF